MGPIRHRPLIEPRQLWKQERQEGGQDAGEAITRPLYPDRADTIVHTERGEVYCFCPTAGVSGAWLSRASRPSGDAEVPLPGGGLRSSVPGADALLPDSGHAGGRLRSHRAHSPRHPGSAHLHSNPYGSPSWKRGYRRRSALERIYSRLDNDFGFERHFLRGRSRVAARVGLAMTVMMALALAQARAGRHSHMRSLVDAVPLANTG